MTVFRDVEHAREFAARTLAAIDNRFGPDPDPVDPRDPVAADRERVTSDLAGIEECHAPLTVPEGHRGAARAERARHLARYTAGLIRTGGLYGEKP